MAKEKPRKSILVTESAFNEFDNRRKALGLNSSETLDMLLNQETKREITLKIDRSNTFSNAENQLRKEGEK